MHCVSRARRGRQRLLCIRVELVRIEMVFRHSCIVTTSQPSQQQIHLVVFFLFHRQSKSCFVKNVSIPIPCTNFILCLLWLKSTPDPYPDVAPPKAQNEFSARYGDGYV